MKEAAGEANMTVITIVLIGVVAAVGLLLVPRLMGTAKAKACCVDAGWFVSGNRCCDPAYGGACSESAHRSILNSRGFKTTDFAGKFSACMAD